MYQHVRFGIFFKYIVEIQHVSKIQITDQRGTQDAELYPIIQLHINLPISQAQVKRDLKSKVGRCHLSLEIVFLQ